MKKTKKKVWDATGVLRWALIIGIMVVTNLFVNYAYEAVDPAPKYEKYCNIAVLSAPVKDADILKQNQEQMLCNEKYQKANEVHENGAFLVVTSAGILALVMSLGFSSVIGAGLALSGVLMILTASMRYWGMMDPIIRVMVLGTGLLTLLWYAYRKFR